MSRSYRAKAKQPKPSAWMDMLDDDDNAPVPSNTSGTLVGSATNDSTLSSPPDTDEPVYSSCVFSTRTDSHTTMLGLLRTRPLTSALREEVEDDYDSQTTETVGERDDIDDEEYGDDSAHEIDDDESHAIEGVGERGTVDNEYGNDSPHEIDILDVSAQPYVWERSPTLYDDQTPLDELPYESRLRHYQQTFGNLTRELKDLTMPAACTMYPDLHLEILRHHLSLSIFTVNVWVNYDPVDRAFYGNPRKELCGKLRIQPHVRSALQQWEFSDGSITRFVFELCTPFNSLGRVLVNAYFGECVEIRFLPYIYDSIAQRNGLYNFLEHATGSVRQRLDELQKDSFTLQDLDCMASCYVYHTDDQNYDVAELDADSH